MKTAYPKEIQQLPAELLQLWGIARWLYHIMEDGVPVLNFVALETEKFLHEHFAKYPKNDFYAEDILSCWRERIKNLPADLWQKFQTLEIIDFTLNHYQETKEISHKENPHCPITTAYDFQLSPELWQMWGVGRFLYREELQNVFYLRYLKTQLRKILVFHLGKYKDLNPKECLTEWIAEIEKVDIANYIVVLPIWLALVGYLERLGKNLNPLSREISAKHEAIISFDLNERLIIASSKDYTRINSKRLYFMQAIQTIKAANEENLRIKIGEAIHKFKKPS